ncbi:MAG: hypothetical protein WAW86_06945 [Gammaproteobacteria bacterium]
MQRNNPEPINLQNLPIEAILRILTNLKISDLNAVAKTSHFYLNLTSENFLNTSYGRSLRFNRWQASELDKLQSNLKKEKQLIQTDRSIPAQIYHHITPILFLLLALHLTNKYYDNPDFSAILFDDAIPSIIFGSIAIEGLIWVSKEFNLSLNITQTELDRLEQFLKDNPILNIDFSTQTTIIANQSTISDLISFLQVGFEKTTQHTREFESFLKTESRAIYKQRTIDASNLPNEDLRSYALNANLLWKNASNEQIDLITTTEANPAPQSSHNQR